MNQPTDIRILLIEDNPGDARLLFEIIKDIKSSTFKITHKNRLEEAIDCLKEEDFDIVLLDLGLPGTSGIETFKILKNEGFNKPVILLTGLNDESIAIQAVKEGAQDYLIKGQVTATILSRSIRYSIERFELINKLKMQSQVDEITGLYNRRGFFELAQRELKLASRNNTYLSVIFVDLDGLKQINDSFGHEIGDAAIKTTACVLRNAFRETDIIARIGGDEFVVLAIGISNESQQILKERISKTLGEFNQTSTYPFTLSMSVGLSIYNPQNPLSIDELLKEADRNMYEDKLINKSKRNVNL